MNPPGNSSFASSSDKDGMTIAGSPIYTERNKTKSGPEFVHEVKVNIVNRKHNYRKITGDRKNGD